MILQLIYVSAVSIFVYMLIFYLVAQLIQDNSIVDIGWGGGFVAVTLVLILYTGNLNFNNMLLAAMIAFWGLRLSIYIYIRNRSKDEDFRYANWRKQWGRKARFIAFFKVFMLQGFVMLIVSLPIIISFADMNNVSIITLAGIALFLLGYYFEVVGDYQLYRFKQKPENKGKIITQGLWKYTRHPNYFGEAVIWWGIFLVALPSNCGWISIVSPIILNLLLRYGSGVPMLEKKYEGRTDWEEYKMKTPAFVPFLKH